MRALILAALLALTPAAAAAQQACDPPTHGAIFRRAAEALGAGNTEDARRDADAVIAACDKLPLGEAARVMRADIALGAGDPKAALAFLAPVPRPAPHTFGPRPFWLAMEAQAALRDEAGLRTERTRLLAAVDAALLGAPALKARKIESFSVAEADVTAYELDLTQSVFRRRYYFAIAPKAATFPRALMITQNTMIEEAMPAKDGLFYFADGYDCGGHQTVDTLLVPRGRGDDKPRYEDARAIALDYAAHKAEMISATETSGPHCAFISFITPGLD